MSLQVQNISVKTVISSFSLDSFCTFLYCFLIKIHTHFTFRSFANSDSRFLEKIMRGIYLKGHTVGLYRAASFLTLWEPLTDTHCGENKHRQISQMRAIIRGQFGNTVWASWISQPQVSTAFDPDIQSHSALTYEPGVPRIYCGFLCGSTLI